VRALFSFLLILITAVLCAWAGMDQAGAGMSDIVLDSLRSNPKLIRAEQILADFEAGYPDTRVIVTLRPSAAASALAARSRRSVQVPAEFKRPGAPIFYNLRDRSMREELRKTVGETVARVSSQLSGTGMRETGRFSYQFGFSAEVTPGKLQQILTHPEVIAVEKDNVQQVHLAQGIPLIRAAVPRNVYRGSGVSIAVTDTGIDVSHPMLGGTPFPNAKVIGGYDTGDNDADPTPGSSGEAHGTACAGIAAGNEGTYDDYIGGVAPGAKLYALKISFGTGGYARDGDTIEAWEWILDNQDFDPGNPILIVSHSFGGGRYYSVCDESLPGLTTAAANLVAAGITVFASSGNDGFCDSMAAPACISFINSVGAVYDANLGFSLGFCLDPAETCAGTVPDSRCSSGNQMAWDTTAADKVAVYSNSSPLLTLFAPSHYAYTTDIVGSGGYNTSGDYIHNFGGTSAAAPYAAGSAAVLQSASMELNGSFLEPDQVRQQLVNNGNNLTDTKVSLTKPRINLANAVTAFLSDTHTLTVTRTGTGSGTVFSNPGGIDCGIDCSEGYAEGTMVTLNAAPDLGYRFKGWAGDGCAGTGPCVLSMDQDRIVAAEFTSFPWPLFQPAFTGRSGGGDETSFANE